ncbi:hypothetical protein [Arthrobacter sp. 2MCAF14]|uniref:hypothetical protein n=1 Tax=Arthrobacter sp. 2MCAF14 TaxID=3232982 RepID=UPI003F8F0CA5
MKSRTLATAVLGSMMGLTVATTATAAPAVQTGQAGGTLTIAQFESDLAQSALLATEAKENYERFVGLPRTKKQRLVNYLNDPGFLTSVVSEMGRASSARDVQVLHGGDVVVSRSTSQKVATSKATVSGAVTLAAAPTVDRVSQYSYSLLGITLTRVRLDMNFSFNLTRITNVNSCVPSYTNYFPLRGMSSTPSSYLSGNNGVCQATWQMAIGWVNGINLGQRSALQKVVQGPWGLVSDTFVNT